MVSTSVQSSNAHVLHAKVMSLLEKRSCGFPSSERVRLLQPLLPLPKKGGSLRPILYFRHLNRALMKRPLRKITSKQILLQICPGDWFFSLYLKEAYFHIHIAPHHRRFLRFAFEGVAYQYTVLPFGLSLAPRIFTQWMYAALSPLRQMRIRILNYLNDWLILAQSEDEILSHRSVLLNRFNRTQVKFFQERAVPQPTNFVPGNSYRHSPNEGGSHARTSIAIQQLAASLKLGVPRPLKAFQRMGLRCFSWACFTCGPLSTG